LGQNALRCQWQIKQSVLCAAVDKIEDQRKPDDFIGHRKPAAKPGMLQVRVLSLGPNTQNPLFVGFGCLYICILSFRLEKLYPKE